MIFQTNYFIKYWILKYPSSLYVISYLKRKRKKAIWLEEFKKIKENIKLKYNARNFNFHP